MLRYSRAAHSSASKKLRLLDIFRMTIMDVNATKEDDDEADDTWARIAPDGSIYRLNALEVESLKHVEDLQAQFNALAEEFKPLLEPAVKEFSDAEVEHLQPSTMTPTYKVLLRTLRKTKVQDVEKDSEKGGLKHGFFPLTEFLLASGTKRLFGGALLLPLEDKARARSMKNKMFALVIMLVQLCSPVLLLWTSLHDKDVQETYINSFPKRFGTTSAFMYELTCLGHTRKAITTMLGALFLIMFIECARAYCHTEVGHTVKARLMPTDTTWRVAGQLTNMWVIFWSVLAMPWLFLEEHTVTDIIMDSLGLIFIFFLDDFGGDALDYLKIDDGEFQKMSSWTVGALAQCPVKIRDIVNPTAAKLEDLFQLNVGPNGLTSFANKDKACQTRLMEDDEAMKHHNMTGDALRAAQGVAHAQASEKTPLASSNADASHESYGMAHKLVSDHHHMIPYEVHAFKYCVSHSDPTTGEPVVETLKSNELSPMLFAWNILSMFLVVAEVVFPIVFIAMYNPCPK